MCAKEDRDAIWERKQAELWDRVFQATQDVVTLADTLADSVGQRVLRHELAKSSMMVGAELVRANAAETAGVFERHVQAARLKAVETDYWLRLVYVLQQQEEVQRDLSSIIAQYASIISMLQRFIWHTRGESQVIRRHTKGPRVD